MTTYKPVTAGECDAVEFTVVNRHFGRPGYLESEVDDFLDRVGNTIADQAREIDRLGVLLEQQRQQVSP